jgi:PilZ domain
MTYDVASTEPKHDARRAPRRRVLKAGVIAYNNRHSTLHCTVRDMSEGGARLLLSGSINAPDTFELLIELDGLEASCAVVARAANEVRVKFMGPVRSVPVARVQVLNPVTPGAQPSLRRKPRLGE